MNRPLSKSDVHRVVDRIVPLQYSVNTQVVIDAKDPGRFPSSGYTFRIRCYCEPRKPGESPVVDQSTGLVSRLRGPGKNRFTVAW